MVGTGEHVWVLGPFEQTQPVSRRPPEPGGRFAEWGLQVRHSSDRRVRRLRMAPCRDDRSRLATASPRGGCCARASGTWSRKTSLPRSTALPEARRRLPPPLARSLAEALDEDGWLRDKALEAWPADRRRCHVARHSASACSCCVRTGGRAAGGDRGRRGGVVPRAPLRLFGPGWRGWKRSSGRPGEGEGGGRPRRVGRGGGGKGEEPGPQDGVPAPAPESTGAPRTSSGGWSSCNASWTRRTSGSTGCGGPAQGAPSGAETPVAAPPSAFARRHPGDRSPARRPDRGAPSRGRCRRRRARAASRSVALPTAIPPDKADAVDWLLKQTEPLTLVVDGYNLSFLLEEPAEFASPDARERLVARLTRLRRMAMAPLRVIAVFDTRNDPSSRRRKAGSRSTSPYRATTRWSGWRRASPARWWR